MNMIFASLCKCGTFNAPCSRQGERGDGYLLAVIIIKDEKVLNAQKQTDALQSKEKKCNSIK